MNIPPNPRRRWWISRSFLRYLGFDPAKPELGVRRIHAGHLRLDFDSLDCYLWLGVAGFRVWWLSYEFEWGWGRLSSGITIYWGTPDRIHDGQKFVKHEDSLIWFSSSPRLRQVAIAGEFHIIEDR